MFFGRIGVGRKEALDELHDAAFVGIGTVDQAGEPVSSELLSLRCDGIGQKVIFGNDVAWSLDAIRPVPLFVPDDLANRKGRAKAPHVAATVKLGRDYGTSEECMGWGVLLGMKGGETVGRRAGFFGRAYKKGLLPRS